MEDLTLALITLTSFVLLFVVAIFADRAGAETAEETSGSGEPIRVTVEDPAATSQGRGTTGASTRTTGLGVGRADVA